MLRSLNQLEYIPERIFIRELTIKEFNLALQSKILKFKALWKFTILEWQKATGPLKLETLPQLKEMGI